MDVVRFIMQKYNARRCAEKTLQEHGHSIQFKEAGQADSAYLLRSQKLELLRTFVEVVSQGMALLNSSMRPSFAQTRSETGSGACSMRLAVER